MAVRGMPLTQLRAASKLLPPSAREKVSTFCRGGGCPPSAGTFCHFTVGAQAIKTEEAAGSL